MSLPPGKKWVIKPDDMVEVEYAGAVYRRFWLRHAATGTDPYWVFVDENQDVIYLPTFSQMRRTKIEQVPPVDE